MGAGEEKVQMFVVVGGKGRGKRRAKGRNTSLGSVLCGVLWFLSSV